MTQKLSSEKLMATLLQSINPGLIADKELRQTVLSITVIASIIGGW